MERAWRRLYKSPNDVHPIFAGPWLQPPLHFAGYSYSEGLTIVKDAIDGFHQLLSKYADDVNFILVDTRGTITRDASRPTGWAWPLKVAVGTSQM